MNRVPRKLVENVCACLGGVPLQDKPEVLPGRRGPRDVDENPVGQAVLWACRVWTAWYTAVQLRACGMPEEGALGVHSIEDDPATEVVRSLAERFLSSSKFAVKYVKEQTTWLSAKLLGQKDDALPQISTREGVPIVSPGQEGVFGGGWVREYLRTIINIGAVREGQNHASRVHSLGQALDLLNSKTGMPGVDDAFVDGVLKGYSEDMTNVRPFGPDTYHVHILKLAVCERIDEITHRIFHGRKLNIRDQIPSLNASYENAQKFGGCFGALLSKWALREQPEETDVCLPIQTDQVLVGDLKIDVKGVNNQTNVVFPGLDLLGSWRQFLDEEILRVLEKGIVDAKPFPIKEPLKCRVITMQEAILTAYTLSMQKEMHGAMKTFGCFQYMGRPIDDWSWNQHFGRELALDEFYVSGDYDGATNNMDPWFSRYAWDSICREMKLPDGTSLYGSVWHQIGLIDLTEHLFDFSKIEGGKLEQRWGQLMGSPTSFPILCLVNAAASSVGLGLTIDDILADESPMVVNGDDLGAICDEGRYPDWKEATSVVGFKLSLGKNYTSKYFLIMNSECHAPFPVSHKAVNRFPVRWEYIGFLNQSLLTGYEKKGICAGDDLKPTMTWRDLGPRARELVYGLPDRMASRCLSQFIKIHRSLLDEVPATCSWFVSEALGGVGLPNIDKVEIPIDNLRTATYLACLDFKKRSVFVRRPKATQRGLIDRWLADSETYYGKLFPERVEDRDPWDVVLESWGIPLAREKSDIGSTLRIAYVLKQYLDFHRKCSAEQQKAFACVGSEAKIDVCPILGSSTSAEEMRRDLCRMNRQLFKAGQTAKGAVSKWNLSDRCPSDDEFCTDLFAGQLSLIRQRTAEGWIPPQEIVIDYRSPVTHPVYLGQCTHEAEYKKPYWGYAVMNLDDVIDISSLFEGACNKTPFLEKLVRQDIATQHLAITYASEWDPTHGLEPLFGFGKSEPVSWVDMYAGTFGNVLTEPSTVRSITVKSGGAEEVGEVRVQSAN